MPRTSALRPDHPEPLPLTAALAGAGPVAIVTVAVAELAPVSVTDAGFTVHFAFCICGALEQLSATAPVDPFAGSADSVNVAVCPLVITADEDPLTVSEKSSPLPESATVSGVCNCVALTVSIPLRAPAWLGVNITPIWQLASTASVVPHPPEAAA